MPLISNSQSVIEGRPSLLAFGETLAATGFSLWLAWARHSIDHLLFASALAPFLLLRTRLSTRYSATVARTVMFGSGGNWRFVAGFALAPLKILTSIKAFFRHPLKSISAIPRNYYRQTLVLDLNSSPRFYPGSEEIIRPSRSRFPLLHANAYGIFQDAIAEIELDGEVLLGSVIFLVALAPVIILSVSFRLAIKSTSILWLPLLWIIFQARPGLKAIDRIKVAAGTALSKVILAYSTLTLVFFVVKLTPLLETWWVFNLKGLGPLGVFLTRLVAPFDLPLWQVASAVNAVLAWAFFFRANRHLVAGGTTEEWPERRLQWEYASFQAVRTTLSVYAIICTFYIGLATAFEAEWPPVRFILFPSGTGGS